MAEETIELSPFEVRSETIRGYVASESMTGTRVATQIKDLPFSVNILTSEFFEDFALFELNENVAYISSFTGLDQGGGFNLRGFNASAQLRDGFFRLGRYGSSNVDRIEVIKGPNAAIYGQTSPGGMINMISKKPRKQSSTRLSLSVGDYDTHRETLDVNFPIGTDGNTYGLLVLGNYENRAETPQYRRKNSEAFLAVQHWFPDNGSLLFQVEYFLREEDSPRSGAPLILDQKGTTGTGDDQIVGIATDLGRVQQFGPNAELNRGMVAVTATYDKRLTDIFSVRAAANYNRARRWDFNQNVGAGQVQINRGGASPEPQWQRGATPNKGIIFEDNGGFQADLLAHYFTGEAEHRTLLTFDYNDYWRYDPNWNIAASALNANAWTAANRQIPLTRNADGSFSLAAPIYYYPEWFDWSQHAPGRENKNRIQVFGTLLRQQTALMDGRLLMYGGARYDKVRYNLNDIRNRIVDPTRKIIRFSVTELSPNAGINFKATPNLSPYVNYSRGFFPNQQFIQQQFTATGDASDFESETAEGWDFGVKGSYFENRLNFTLAGYRIERKNVVVSEREVDPITGIERDIARAEGDHLVRGFEIEGSWQVNDSVTVGAGWGHIKSEITDLGFRTMSIGRSPARITPDNAYAWVKWSPTTGALSAFSANLGLTYFAATPTEGPDSGDRYTNGVFSGTNEQWRTKVPEYTLVNGGIRYNLPFGGDRMKHTIGLNVNNILDKEYLTSGKSYGDRRSFFLNYTLRM